MKLVLLNDTSGHANWGCQATSAGLKRVISTLWPDASVMSQPADKLPWRRLPVVRRYLDRQIAASIADGNRQRLGELLERYGIALGPILDADCVVLNGEGMIHSGSGHLMRILGVLSFAKQSGRRVAVVNQTVDLQSGDVRAVSLTEVYGSLDLVAVRDPDSLDLMQRLGVNKAVLIPDAAFATSVPDEVKIQEVLQRLQLPERFVAMTGSSSLTRRDGDVFAGIVEEAQKAFGHPVVLLASTKTDLLLGEDLRRRGYDIPVLDATCDYEDVVCVIAGAQALVGGRFHPMVFAALVGTPLVAFQGNTHKVRGLMRMLNYDAGEIKWSDNEACAALMSQVGSQSNALSLSLRQAAESNARDLFLPEKWAGI